MSGTGRIDDREPRVAECDLPFVQSTTPRALIVGAAMLLRCVHPLDSFVSDASAKPRPAQNSRDATHANLRARNERIVRRHALVCARSHSLAPVGPTGPTQPSAASLLRA